MGMAASGPSARGQFLNQYYAPQPRAVLLSVVSQQHGKRENSGEWGRVDMTTLTREFFMRAISERDRGPPARAADPYRGTRGPKPPVLRDGGRTLWKGFVLS